MKKFATISAVACAFVLCFALAGCGSSSSGSAASSTAATSGSSAAASQQAASASADSASASAAATSASSAAASASAASASATAAAADSKFTGDWRMLDGVVNGTSYSASDLATANNMGMGVTFSLKSDGTFNLEGGGDTLDTGTWTEADGKVTANGGTFGEFTCSLDSTGIMTMTINGEDSHFSKK